MSLGCNSISWSVVHTAERSQCLICAQHCAPVQVLSVARRHVNPRLCHSLHIAAAFIQPCCLHSIDV